MTKQETPNYHTQYVTVGELAEICGVNVKRLQYWTIRGLLPYTRRGDGDRRNNLFHIKDSKKRVRKILSLKKKRWTISEILEELNS